MKKALAGSMSFIVGMSFPASLWSMSLKGFDLPASAVSGGSSSASSAVRGAASAPRMGVSNPVFGMIEALHSRGLSVEAPLNDVGTILQVKDALAPFSASPVHAELDHIIDRFSSEDGAIDAGGVGFDGSILDSGHAYLAVDGDSGYEAVHRTLHEAASGRETPKDRVMIIPTDDRSPAILEVPPGSGVAFASAVNRFGDALKGLGYEIARRQQGYAEGLRQSHAMVWERFQKSLASLRSPYNLPTVGEIKGEAPIPGGKFGVEIRSSKDPAGRVTLNQWWRTYEGRYLEGQEVEQKVRQGAFTWDEWETAATELQTLVDAWRREKDRVEESYRQRMAEAPQNVAHGMIEENRDRLERILYPRLDEFNRRADLRKAAIGAAEMALRKRAFGRFTVDLRLTRDSKGRHDLLVWALEKGESRTDRTMTVEELLESGRITNPVDRLALRFIRLEARKLRATIADQESAQRRDLEAMLAPYSGAKDYVEGLSKFAQERSGRWLEDGPPQHLFRARALSDNRGLQGAPVIWKDSLRPEEVHAAIAEARGGILALPAMELFWDWNEGTWPALINALRSAGAQVVLVGPPLLMMILQHHDPYFKRNFKGVRFSGAAK